MENKLVSIIVPFYNVEDYIAKCLDSIISQSYKHLEIICIDDGSTDKSGIIVQEYAKKDLRIIYKKQKNQGAAIARNNGLDIAIGGGE